MTGVRRRAADLKAGDVLDLFEGEDTTVVEVRRDRDTDAIFIYLEPTCPVSVWRVGRKPPDKRRILRFMPEDTVGVEETWGWEERRTLRRSRRKKESSRACPERG
jgi:hypothetical protein